MVRFLIVGSVLGLAFLGALAPAMGADVARQLSYEDASRYNRIFDLQEDGKWQAADREIKQLQDRLIIGHVLYQRYMHPTAYRSSYTELKRWLDQYADQPDAKTIYQLARKRRPSGYKAPIRPQPRRWRTDDDRSYLHPDLQRDYDNAKNLNEVRRIERYVRYLNKDDRPTQALNYINAPKYRNQLSQRQYDRIRSWIAESYYYNDKIGKARKIANDVANRNGDKAVLAYWIGGLAAWRVGDKTAAADYFSRMADVPWQTPQLRSAAGFWAARGALATGNTDNVTRFLQISAKFPYTFYGQLSLSQLGQDAGLSWQAPELSFEAWTDLSEKSPRVRRAAALAEAGQYDLAQMELRWAHGELTNADDPALMALAFDLNLWAAQVTMALASGAERPENAALQAGLFPVPDFTPTGGFTMDKAVIFGLIRQESKFQTDARSRVGATGLMQLMPRTASFVAGDRSLQYRSQRGRLADASYNMQLGQSYVEALLKRHTGGNLLEMTLAYNWGPGNLRRWKNKTNIEDQLLMIESVPNPEARDFVEKVMTNIWLYRDRFNQPAPSRDAVAAGKIARYQSVE